MNPFTRLAIAHLAKQAKRGDFAAGRELLRRAIVQCDQSADRDSALSEWLKEFLRAALDSPRYTVRQLIAPDDDHFRRVRPSLSSLNHEIYLRVCDALDAGEPRKRAFSDVARQLNVLGYRTSKNKPLRATSVERQYYAVRRNIDST